MRVDRARALATRQRTRGETLPGARFPRRPRRLAARRRRRVREQLVTRAAGETGGPRASRPGRPRSTRRSGLAPSAVNDRGGVVVRAGQSCRWRGPGWPAYDSENVQRTATVSANTTTAVSTQASRGRPRRTAITAPTPPTSTTGKASWTAKSRIPPPSNVATGRVYGRARSPVKDFEGQKLGGRSKRTNWPGRTPC